ncbi:helix-turn-helix domain-containing protein [Patescibacteria group bacterium]|nr:helix-turn-helix domain-containing protein [Patescibacteria group bacterium]
MNFLGNIRAKNRWTQAEMANFIGVSRPTYISLEKGEISITIDQLNKLADKIGCDPQDVLSQEVVNEEKYREVLLETIRHGAATDGKITKTKLAKLIYLNDFSWYYQHLESMTGAKYRRLAQGPVPNIYFAKVEELITEGVLNLEIKNGSQMISLSRAGLMQKPNLLTIEEKNQIKKVSLKWFGKRTEEIVKFTHEQLPYKICSPGEVIPYELITQQEPEYVY